MIFVKDISNPENSFCKQSSQIYIEDINLGIIHVWYKPKKLEIWEEKKNRKEKQKTLIKIIKEIRMWQNPIHSPIWLTSYVICEQSFYQVFC